jgi:Cft2 family RNA processing exonuclease
VSGLNVRTLREAAEKATYGEWHVDSHTKIDKWFGLYDSSNRGIEICKFDYDDVDHEQADDNARFIAACNPAAILQLLDARQNAVAALDEKCIENMRLRTELEAMTTARDEACEIASRLAGSSDAFDERLSALRSVGQ